MKTQQETIKHSITHHAIKLTCFIPKNKISFYVQCNTHTHQLWQNYNNFRPNNQIVELRKSLHWIVKVHYSDLSKLFKNAVSKQFMI